VRLMIPTHTHYLRHSITRWLPRLHHRALFTTLVVYSLICLSLNHVVKTTFEDNAILAEREHIEKIARFYHSNPLMDRYGLMAEGHSLWEAMGQTFPALTSIMLLDTEGIPLSCFQRNLNPAPTVFRTSTSCSRLQPPAASIERTWEYHLDRDIFWQMINTPSTSPAWLRIETLHTHNIVATPFLKTLLSAEIVLGLLLLILISITTRHLEHHLNTLTQRLRLFDYSGFKDTSRTTLTSLPWSLSDLEWALHGVLDRVKKEIIRLQQSEASLDGLLNHLPGAIIQHDTEGHCLFLSSSWATLIGEAPSPHLVQRPFEQFIHPDHLNTYKSHVQTLLSGEHTQTTVQITLSGTQPSQPLELHLVKHINAAGITTILGYAYDCSTTLAREQALIHENKQLHQWLEHLPLPMYIKNHLGQYLFFNLAWERLTQVSRVQWIGKTAWDVFEPTFAQTLWDRERETLDQKTTTAHETDVRNQLGQTQRALVYRAPILENDQPIGMIGLIASLDKHVHHTDLQTRLDRAEQQDRQHTQMLAHLSDKIRTHLHSLLGLVDLMNAWLKTLALPHNNEYLGLIHTLAHSILNTTTDVNDILSFEQRTALPQPALFNLEAVLIECARHFSPQAESKHLELIVNIDPSLPDQVEADVHLLRRALDPLIHNAIKFTPSGSVELSATLLRIEYDQVCIRFSVSDTGIGIHEDQHQHIFEPFAQGDAALSRQHQGGSGLGLSVFSRLMHHIGASYHISSQPGHGTTLYFDWALPYTQPLPPNDIHALFQRTLLIVEDHARTSQVIAQLATSWSMNILAARTVHQALTILNDSDPSNTIIDAILIDGRLSDDDRSAPYKILEAAHARGIHHRLMMLPVNAPFREHERYRQAHATTILLKPLHRQELLNALLESPTSLMDMSHNEAVPPSSPHATTTLSAHHHSRMLLATHDPINRKLAEGWLEQLGHRCITVSTAEELMSYFTSERFGAIFIDLDMPRSSGNELLHLVSIQNRILDHHTPIIVMFSGKYGEYLIPSDTPVWGHIQKPIQQNILSAMLNSLQSFVTGSSQGNTSPTDAIEKP